MAERPVHLTPALPLVTCHSSLVTAFQRCRQQRYHNFVMARERIPMAAVLTLSGSCRRPQQDVLLGAVMLDEVHVYGGDSARRTAEVGRQAQAFQEYFGQHDGRADVQVNAA